MSEPSSEVVLKEHPSITLLLEDSRVKAGGNLILTNERLVFLKQVALNERKAENIQKLAQGGDVTELLKYTLTLNKNNFQIPLTSVIRVKTGFLFGRPINLCMHLTYYTVGRKKKTLGFIFKTSFLKVLFRSEPLTWMWVRAVSKAVKVKKKQTQEMEAANETAEVNEDANTK